MIIAIASEKEDINSKIDERFGLCNYFYVYDTDTQKGDFSENPYKESNQGVGSKIVEFLANKSVKEIFVVEVGEKALGMLSQLNIKTNIMIKNNTIDDIISKLN